MTGIGLPLASMRAGSARRRWQHPKAVWAADFGSDRYFSGGPQPLNSVVTCSRASTHLLTGPDGIVRSFAANKLARINALGAYVGGTATNLVFPSQDFTDAGWGKTNVSVAGASGSAPDVSMTACKVTDNASGGAHLLTGNAVSFSSGATYVYSEYFKQGTQRYAQIAFPSSAFGLNAYANFDLQAGAVGAVGSSATAFIVALADGWYRCIIVATATASSSNVVFFGFVTSAAGARGQSYIGTGTYFYAWGAQAEAGKSVSPYVPTTTAAAPRYASDVAAVASGSDPFADGTAAAFTNGLSFLAAINLSHVGDGVNRFLCNLYSGADNNNRAALYLSTVDKITMSVVTGGVAATATIPTALTAGRHVIAGGYDPVAGIYLVRKTALEHATAAAIGAVPPVAHLALGNNPVSGGVYLNDTIEQLQVGTAMAQSELNAWAAAA